MLKPDALSSRLICEHLREKEYSIIVGYLKESFTVKRSEHGAPLKYEFSEDVVAAFCDALKLICNSEMTTDVLCVVKEIFRCLRNYVINPDVQYYLLEEITFLLDVKLILHKMISSGFVENIPIIIQFMSNLVVSNGDACEKLHELFIADVLSVFNKGTATYEISALLYYISLHKKLSLDVKTYSTIFHHFDADEQCEYLSFLIENSFCCDNFWEYFERFELNHQILLLTVIEQNLIDDRQLTISEVGIKTLKNSFIQSQNVIFQTVSSTDHSLEPHKASLLLRNLSVLSSNEKYTKDFQNDKDLIIHCAVLLINIHRLGKQSDNYFSPIQTLSEIRAPSETISQHPAFGFKTDLIRIIGNMCWKNKMMQDLAREAELIPVILDCCNMDARNPLMMQWAIFAISNLCNDNVENQKIIAEMHEQGTITSVTELENIGLTVHNENGKPIKIVPMEALRKF